MKKNYLLWVAFVVTTFTYAQTYPGDIIITEIMQNPAIVADATGEYFEVYNMTGSDIDMIGWVISDLGIDSHTITSSLIVPANGYAVLGISGNLGLNGGVNVNYVYTGITLANADDELLLTDSFSGLIDQVNWDGGPAFPDPNGASMELLLTNYNNVGNDIGASWGTAVSVFGSGDKGTPGTVTTLSVVKNQIDGFSMYPNPVANGKFSITSKSKGIKQVEIYSLLGKQVYSKNLKANQPIEVFNLNRGIYILKVEEEGKIATRKLVIE